jgi:hypothetical protein
MDKMEAEEQPILTKAIEIRAVCDGPLTVPGKAVEVAISVIGWLSGSGSWLAMSPLGRANQACHRIGRTTAQALIKS